MLRSEHSRRLLILSCSRSKRTDPTPLPAIDRYDGPMFRVVRRYLANLTPASLDIYILSARYGLIEAHCPIHTYDQKMTSERASELQSEVKAGVQHILESQKYHNICLSLSKSYWQSIQGCEELFSHCQTAQVGGSNGQGVSDLYRWLYADLPKLKSMEVRPRSGPAIIKGVAITLSKDEVLDKARMALETDAEQASRFHSWYVDVDGQRISPKWLVGKLTGLSVSDFHTETAKRVLNAIGIDVRYYTGDNDE